MESVDRMLGDSAMRIIGIKAKRLQYMKIPYRYSAMRIIGIKAKLVKQWKVAASILPCA